MTRRGWGVLAAMVMLGCGSGGESPATTTAPPTTAPPSTAPPSTTTTAHDAPTIPAPASCVRAAACCHGYLAALGVGDEAVQTSACAPLGASVFDARVEETRCASQLEMWRGELAALGAPPVADCAAAAAPALAEIPASQRERVDGVDVEARAGSLLVHTSDVPTLERVLARALAPFSFEGGVRADASLDHGPTVTFAAGAPYTRALAYDAPRVIDTDPETVEPLHVIALVGASESRLLVLSAADDASERPSALTMEAAPDGASLHVTWTSERTGGTRALEAGDASCTASYAAERSVTHWDARCALTGEPQCTYAATSEEITADPSPSITCLDDEAHPVATPEGTSAPPLSHEAMARQLVEDASHGIALRDHDGTDLGAQLHRSEGDLAWVCDDERRAADVRRDPALRALEASHQEVGGPECVIERRELPDFASMNGDEGMGSWIALFARDHGTWRDVEATFLSTLAMGDEDEDDEDESPGRTAGVPVALDLVPGGATELLVPVRCALGEATRCDGIIVCGERDTTTRCRALPLRVTEGEGLVSRYDAVRFDLAGHVALTPHGGSAETVELAAWLAEEEPAGSDDEE